MKIMVTGGAGFIGSALIRYILDETNDQVINVDKLTYAGNLESIPQSNDNARYTLEQIDICNAKEIERVFEVHQPEIVMHLAAESHVDKSISGPSEFIQTNIVGTYTLLEAARRFWENSSNSNKNKFRFHHISTDEVYGDLLHPDYNPDGIDLPFFTEETAYSPSSPYSASKASSDHLVRAWHRTYGLPTIITNCSNNYGPYHFPEKLIPHVILNALSGKALPIYGDGSQIRDWLYVEDHVKALYKVIMEGKVGETYNIGGHNEKRNIEVVEKICELLEELAPEKVNGVINYHDLICFVGDRPGHDLRYAINPNKIANNLNWIPEESFESGLRKTVEWFLNNESWWKKVIAGNNQVVRTCND